MHVRKIIREIRKPAGATPLKLVCTMRTPFGVGNTYLKGGRHLEMVFYPIFSNRDAICKWLLAFTVEFAKKKKKETLGNVNLIYVLHLRVRRLRILYL
ncbi:hypothetical protein GQ457_06G040500 [Hibiscus cannabinus]